MERRTVWYAPRRMKHDLTSELGRRVLMFDGAMGTELYRRHFFVNASFEGLCLTQPEVVRDIHRSYVEAGADVVTTNSFGANRNKLAVFGLAERTAEINAAAVQLARACAGPDRLVAGSVGPFGEIPFGADYTPARRTECLAEQARALEAAGADFILFETLGGAADVELACRAGATVSVPYVISITANRDGETRTGESLATVLEALPAEGRTPAALGLNCGEGPEATLGALEILRTLTSLPLIIRPNAGTPKNVDGRMIYMTSPEYFTTYAQRYIALGARAVGGCCGTGPDHIRDMARSVRPLAAATVAARPAPAAAPAGAALREPVPLGRRSKLGAKLAAREWVVTVEITPPRGWDLGPTLDKARQCRAAGVDAINIPDGPRASARLSPMITAQAIQNQADIETILHVCCRDKSLLAMQADLLGCAAAGLHNLLFITGDPPKLGDFPMSTAVFDADSIGMAGYQNRMNRGVDLGGKALDAPTAAVIGVGADPNAVDAERELRRLREKVAAGAEFIITQPVFAAEPLFRFLDAIRELRVPVLAGLWPLASYRNAEFMRNEVPGVVVPDEIMRRMGKADSREAQREEGIAIARETLARIRPRVSGVQISAPFGHVPSALAVARG